VALVVVLICTHRGRKPRPDVDEDIQRPRVEVIDDALRRVGADNRGAQDWLLDRRLAEMQRRAAS
jgi:hypothetical protein